MCNDDDKLRLPEAASAPVSGRLAFIVDDSALDGLENSEKFNDGDAVTAAKAKHHWLALFATHSTHRCLLNFFMIFGQ